jgi:2-polyprenyl-3-methyl-5-hydroxy-6-metoxy-1,4-benzoquinol methylase
VDNSDIDDKFRRVEKSVKEVYEFCPPTRVNYASRQAFEEDERQLSKIYSKLGIKPEEFVGLKVLDIGCGSCDKTVFFHDWGANVTGIDITPKVLSIAKEKIGKRDIELIMSSVFDFKSDDKFDLITSDGVLHCTADTYKALQFSVRHLKTNGTIVFSLINVYGKFWWFPFARFIVFILGGRDFHKRAKWGKRLFKRFRKTHEGTKESSKWFRSEDSWAYDWFANPRWNLHSPQEVLSWLPTLGLKHIKSIPSIVSKEEPKNKIAKIIKAVFGEGSKMISLYWFVNKEPNTMYIAAKKSINGKK